MALIAFFIKCMANISTKRRTKMPKGIKRMHPEEAPFYGPKSICACGHAGDGIVSAHEDRISPGHGPCKIPGCKCEQFTWAKITQEYKTFMGIR
jgi:hypothetical protein